MVREFKFSTESHAIAVEKKKEKKKKKKTQRKHTTLKREMDCPSYRLVLTLDILSSIGICIISMIYG